LQKFYSISVHLFSIFYFDFFNPFLFGFLFPSLYRSRAGSHFYGKSMRFALILGRLPILKKTFCATLEGFFFMFSGAKKIISKYYPLQCTDQNLMAIQWTFIPF
jgi:hypothetical protein